MPANRHHMPIATIDSVTMLRLMLQLPSVALDMVGPYFLMSVAMAMPIKKTALPAFQ